MGAIFVQEVLSVRCFDRFLSFSFIWFIIYTIFIAFFSFAWGLISDLIPRKIALFMTLFLGLLPIYLSYYFSPWALISSFLLVPQPIARAIMASHKFRILKGKKEVTTGFLMKISWLIVFFVWMLYYPIQKHPTPFLVIAWLLSVLFLFIIPKNFIPFHGESTPFTCRFFAIWSFSEKVHVTEVFFPFVGASCFIGTVLSFLIDSREPHLRILSFSYLFIILITSISVLVLFIFMEMKTWLVIAAVVASTGGVYLPYIYDQAVVFYGKNEKGKACGIIDSISSISNILGTVFVSKIHGVFFISMNLVLFSLVGYFFQRKQKAFKILLRKN